MSRTSGPANRRTVDSDAAALLKEELAEKEQLLAGRRQKEWIKTEQFKNQDLRVRLADRIAQSKAEIESELARDKKKNDVALRNVKKALESNRLPDIGLWDKNFEAVLGKIESGQGSLKALVQNYPPKEMLRLADDLLDQEESVEDIKQASRCAMEKHQKEQAASTKRKDIHQSALAIVKNLRHILTS